MNAPLLRGWPAPLRLREGLNVARAYHRGLITTRMANEYKVVPMSDSRFPRSVFAVGTDPDPRFTLANERTFLAWIRTSLALIAGGVALEAFDVPLPAELRSAVSVFMLVVAIILPLVAWVHWKQSERAMREERPLPFSFAIPVLVAALLALFVALPLSMLIFKKWRIEATQTLAEYSAQRKAHKRWVQAELEGRAAQD